MIYNLIDFSEFREKQIEFKSKADPYDIARAYERYLQSYVANYANVFHIEFLTVSNHFEKMYINRTFSSVFESLKWCEKRGFATLENYLSMLTNAANSMRDAKEILKLQLNSNDYLYLAQKVAYICKEIYSVVNVVETATARLREYEELSGI